MNKLRYAHDKHDDRSVVFQAAALAILFHTFLLVVFYIPADDYSQRVLSNKRIRMFNSVKPGPMASDLSSILYYGDPTVISKPRHSYSIKVRDDLNYVDDVVLDKKTAVYMPRIDKFTALAQDKVKADRSSALIGSYATVYPFTISSKAVKHPIATTSNGAVLKDFSVGGTENLKGKKTPAASTKYKVITVGKGIMPRVTIINNSGSVEHDKLGAIALLRHFGKANTQASTKYISIKWGDTK